MAKCVPGMPCYNNDVIIYTTYPAGCPTTTPSALTLPLASDDIYYAGPALYYAGIDTSDTLTVALQKIDEKLSPTELVNLIIAAMADEDLRVALCAALNC